MKSPKQAMPKNRQNSGETPTNTATATETPPKDKPETTGLDNVRFDHAHNGTISLNGTTNLGCLLELGAITNTMKINYDKNGGKLEYATDDKGLEIVANNIHGGIESLFNGIAVIGKLLGYSSSEIGEDDISSVGWLLCGLAEIGEGLRMDLANIEYSKEQGRKGGD